MSESRNQFAGTLLLLLTVAAVVGAVLSFKSLRSYALHDDGVTWVERVTPNGKPAVVAAYIARGGPGDKAYIHTGDELVAIGPYSIQRAIDVPQVLWKTPLGPVRYTLRRDGIEFSKQNIFIQAAGRDTAVYYQYLVGAFYLVIGLFVYYRRTSAAKSRHFYLLCLFSFAASSFHYSGKLNTFDEVMYWGNLVGNLFAPAIFLHFCLTFRGLVPTFSRRKAWLLIYALPSVILALTVLASQGVLRFETPLLEVRWLLDRITMGFAVLFYLAGAGALAYDLRRADDPMARRQLKYLRNGALVGLLPFTVLYAVPYTFGAIPTHLMSLSVLSMGLIPLTWAYAITRYRLLDVDIIFQQGYVYTLATLFVIGFFYGLMFLLFNTATITPPAFVVLIAFATFLFQPIRRWIQELLDRWIFYRDRYDARATLLEFARELSSETDQDAMLTKVSDRLRRTLSIQQIGFFLFDEESRAFRLHSMMQKGGKNYRSAGGELDLRFLEEPAPNGYHFFEQPRHLRDIVSRGWPASIRETIAELDFTLYVACKSRGNVIAFIGVSRTTEGDFLSLDDVELLGTLSNYVAIAIENSRLYSSLQSKADEYERLKEFSENIVESINVGILAAGLDQRIESWNAEMERLTGRTRADAVGRRLDEVFSSAMCEQFDSFFERPSPHVPNKTTLQLATSEQPGVNGTAATANRSGLELAHGKPASREPVVNLAVAPLLSRNGAEIGRLIILEDITDRDELERKLVQADKLSSIGLLAAGVAHEVNTPLAVISTYSQMLAKQVSEDEQKSKLLEKIAKQTFRASEIVNSLLNFSRTSPTDYVDLDLNRVLRETCSLVEHQFDKIGVTVKLNLLDPLPPVRGNSGKLQQVFLNLFINARDAMPGGGALSVRSWAESGHVHVEVADTGQGISPENLRRIYDPFFSTKGPKKGTGLGLSITYGIVQEHNGIIEVDSAPGRGTRFRLELPVAAAARLRTEGHREALPA